MLIIKINKENLGLITSLNGGVTPEIEKKVTYLVVEGGVINKIITHPELMELKKKQNVVSTTLNNKVFVA